MVKVKKSNPSEFESFVISETIAIIQKEIKELCSNKKKTSFRLENLKEASSFSYSDLVTDLKTTAPNTYNIVIAIGRNPRKSASKSSVGIIYPCNYCWFFSHSVSLKLLDECLCCSQLLHST